MNDDFKTNININRVSLQFNGDIELKEIFIEDYRKDTLIAIEELNTSILNFKNLSSGDLVFGDIDIEGLVFNIKTYKGENDTNLDVFVNRFETDNPKQEKSDFLLSSSDVSIYNGVFSLSNENRETVKQLHFKNLNINATNFLIHGSDVSARINTLNFEEWRGLQMKNLMTDFAYTLKDMTFANLQIKTPNSVLKGDLKFSYNREDLQYFTDKVLVSASFKESDVLLDELNTFYNEFGTNQKVRFSVDLSGTLNDLKATDFRLNTSTNTRGYGNVSFKNLFNSEPNNFYMKGDFKSLSSTYRDLKGLLPNVLGKSIPTSFETLGKFTITGNTQITASKVIANIKIKTELGLVDSNLEVDKINDIDNSAYKGNVIFEEFDFGTFLNAPKVGFGSLNFDVNGQGFTAENIDTKVKGDIFQMEYNDYSYSGIKVAGNVMNKIFDGNLIVNDRNLKMIFNGLVDFSEYTKKYDFEAVVDYANLNTLNFVKKDSISVFSSRVQMNMNAGSFDDAYGRISFKNTVYRNVNDTYRFDKFDITSRFEDKIRYVSFNSPDIIQGDLRGRFFLKDLKKLFENSIGYVYSNYIPHEVEIDQGIDFNFKVYNKIVEVIYPEVELGKNTFIRGRVESDERQFKLTFKSPKIKLFDYLANNIELQVDNSNPVFDTYVEIDRLNTKYYNVSDFNLINITVNDTLFMRSEFKGGKRNNDRFNLSFYHTINEDSESVVGFKKSDFTIKNNKWLINENDDEHHKVSFDKKLSKFDIDKFKVNHNNEEIHLSGFIKDSTQKDINLDFTNVDLAKITPDIDSLSLAGNVNGKLDILQQNGSYLPNSSIVIDGFKVNDFLLGSFDANISGNETLSNYGVNATIKDDTSKSFSAKGKINVLENRSEIDVDLDFNAFKLYPLNPLLAGILSNIRGEVTGKVKVDGNLKRPDFNGDLVLTNAGLAIPYLNVDYDFNNKASLTLKNQTFEFNNIGLTDVKYKSKGRLNGTISHVNFSKWGLGLDISTSRLLILDTQETEEALYYGTGFIGGRASIYGPTEQLVIDVTGTTEAGTVFKIPLSDAASFGDNTYIHFITKEEKRAQKEGMDLVFNEIDGLELDFDLDVTEDAEVELIIDKSTGHSLKGRGRGGLLVSINTNGKFDMWGDFAVFEGVYNFAYGGLVQKQFEVQPGGTIAWNGNPLRNTTIDMLAVYKTRANPSPLLDTPINRTIPVELQITLVGELEQPEPEFDFDFPNVNSTVKSELNYRLQSKEDKQNQALYLLSTASFSSGLNDLSFSGTIAERLNGIVNGIFSGGDSKFNIGLNYEAGQNRPDYQTDDRVGVTLQTQISDRVSINGKVGVPVGGGGASQTVVAGDVEISFLLNDEGSLTANVFNRENSIRNFGEDIGYTQGVGIAYNVDFDTFKELLQKLFKKSEKEEEIVNENSENEEENVLPNYISVKPSSEK
ncbi:translocation/assembly module TamB domain-containing protein [Tamlana sp. 2201CG12-4]|uniref:translocation/assembly module TamB domain-containing protein n=1 Tax=Tamlana sp. 2201CG12-4 TaxID=3112582 RepID=UPI002DBF068B|nr:translocation/assembly module TamB domain-containing protein [Tamlana sp. 2201CG12-4]MEC3907900.1 translocation/assembly module TamB domain-containing protein [Tamlana sp. 2201CG12-4]